MEKIKVIRFGVANCYLIRCKDGYLVIDTFYSNFFNEFITKLNQLGIDLKEIKYLLLTHHHHDHAGFARNLVEKTGCKLILHENSIPALKKGESEDVLKPLNFRIKLLFMVLDRFIHPTFTYPSICVRDHDIVITGSKMRRLDDIGINGNVVYTPGHTNDSISLILDNGKVFIGDAAMNFRKFTGARYRPILVENKPEVFKSWKRLLTLGAKEIYPSHGEAFHANKLVTTMRKESINPTS